MHMRHDGQSSQPVPRCACWDCRRCVPLMVSMLFSKDAMLCTQEAEGAFNG